MAQGMAQNDLAYKVVAQEAGDLAKIMERYFKDFVEALVAFLEKNSEYKPYKELANFVKEGKTHFYAMQCGNRGYEEFVAELKKREIPFLEAPTSSQGVGFLIPSERVTEVRDIDESLLIVHSRKKEVVAPDIFEDAVARFTGSSKSKEVVTMEGMDPELFKYFLSKVEGCATGKGSFAIGVDHDKRTIVFKPSNVCGLTEKEIAKRDICDTLLEAVIAMYGPQGETHQKELVEREKYENYYQSELKRSKDKTQPDFDQPKYVVGCGGTDTYIMIQNGKETLYRKNKDDQFVAHAQTNEKIPRHILSQIKNPSRILSKAEFDAWANGVMKVESYTYQIDPVKNKADIKQKNENHFNDVDLAFAVEKTVKAHMNPNNMDNNAKFEEFHKLTNRFFEELDAYASKLCGQTTKEHGEDGQIDYVYSETEIREVLSKFGKGKNENQKVKSGGANYLNGYQTIATNYKKLMDPLKFSQHIALTKEERTRAAEKAAREQARAARNTHRQTRARAGN